MKHMQHMWKEIQLEQKFKEAWKSAQNKEMSRVWKEF